MPENPMSAALDAPTVEEVVVTGKRRKKRKPLEGLLSNPLSLLQGAQDAGARFHDYVASGRADQDVSRLAEDPVGSVVRGGKAVAKGFAEDFKEHPVKTVAGLVPFVGGALSALDTSALRDQAEEARQRGDESAARRLEELAAISSATIAAGVLPGGRAVGKAGVRAIENAAERDVVRDVSKLTEKYGLKGLQDADDPRLISTRRPTAPNYLTEGNPDERLLIQTGDALRRTPAAFDKNMSMLAEEPFMRGANTTDPEKLLAYGTREGANNLKFITNELMSPSQVDAARPWYVTANKLSGRNAEILGQPLEAGAGVMAVLSPQTPWDTNVAKAERLTRMYASDFETPEADVMRWVQGRRAAGPQQVGAVARLPDADLLRIANTPMSELPPNSFDRYAKVVMADAVQNPPEIRAILPTGDYGDVSGTITWGQGNEINKALNILRDPSMANISQQMEGGGKVPSFYNNIVAPYSRAPISTIDTHSTGAFSLYPGGGKDPIVYRGMGLSPPQKGMPPGAASPATTGAKGLYGPISDAHALAGTELDFQPRETQSVTWEGVRDLWGQSGKTAKLKQDIADIWRTAPSADDARYAIAERLGRPVTRVYPSASVLGEKYGLPEFTTDLSPEQVSANRARFLEGSQAPQDLYHGTRNWVGDAYDPSFPPANRVGNNVTGFYADERPARAENYTADWRENSAGPAEGSQILPVHMAIKNPFVPGRTEVTEPMVEQYKTELRAANRHMSGEHADEWIEGKAADFRQSRLPSIGALNGDGMAYQRVLRAGGHDGMKDGTAWVAFEPTQIKSRFNRGTFDPEDPHLHKAMGGLVEKYGL